MPWYVLTHIPKQPGNPTRIALKTVEIFNRSHGSSLTLFAPTIKERIAINGTEENIERALTYHYVFLKATLEEAMQLCALDNGFSLVLSRSSAVNRYAILSDEDMAVFQRIAAVYKYNLSFFSIEDVDLEKGDKIEIVGGEFAGLKGTFLYQPRSNKGNVVITTDNNFASMVFNIKVSQVRILEFSPSTNRYYDIIDAFIPRLLDAKATVDAGKQLTERQLERLVVFTRRMGSVKLDNHKIEAKLLGLLLRANILMKAPESEIALLRARLLKRLPAVTNPKTLCFLKDLLNE